MLGDSNGLAPPEAPARTNRPLRFAVSALLIVTPVALSLAVPLYQRTEPMLIGIPFFYWFQLAMTVVTALGTITVYRLLFTGEGEEGQ